MANFNSANLSEARLLQARGNYVNLANVELQDADLQQAHLVGANLKEANLTQADLLSANLQQANLKQANLTQADLSQVDLSHANLSHARMIATQAFKTNFQDANLTGVSIDKLRLDRQTLFDGVVCQYLYLHSEQRYPSEKNFSLSKIEFDRIIDRLTGNVDLAFTTNLDWVVVLLTLQKLQSKYQTEQIYIQGIQNFRSGIKVSLYIAPELEPDYFAEIFWRKYESLLASKKKHRENSNRSLFFPQHNSPINSQVLTTRT